MAQVQAGSALPSALKQTPGPMAQGSPMNWSTGCLDQVLDPDNIGRTAHSNFIISIRFSIIRHRSPPHPARHRHRVFSKPTSRPPCLMHQPAMFQHGHCCFRRSTPQRQSIRRRALAIMSAFLDMAATAPERPDQSVMISAAAPPKICLAR